MKKLKNNIINSFLFERFRKSFLKRILKDITLNKTKFCCLVWSYHRIFICWKDLKEVKENMSSKYLIESINYDCSEVWFWFKEDRISFLKECLSKFK